ncbi:MAG: chorismate-binding protein, partial [Anaerolineae bacterium]|nr:chorismate-binding protein [Anaerolineae bacterium]
MPALTFQSLDETARQHYQRALAAFYQAAVIHQLPVALWRYPRSKTQYAIVDFNGKPNTIKIDFHQKAPGFAFSPFVNQDNENTLFISANLHLTPNGHQVFDMPPAGNVPAAEANKTRFLDTYHTLLHSDSRPPQSWVASRTQPHLCSEAEYCALVEAAIDYTNSTGIKKIVTSRATETPLPDRFDPVATFKVLGDNYPHAFVSLVSIPTVGTWIGVSPELLLSVTRNEARTVALAGTQPRPENLPVGDVRWGAKEIEEQALVSDYVRDFFQAQGFANFIQDGPHTVTAGQIVHLQTEFKLRLNEPALSDLANHVLHTLHPTSAVCGMPKQEALAFILEHENYDRAFYSGFLGPIYLQGQSDLFVNLRCMQLKQETAILYVGGGITKDS